MRRFDKLIEAVHEFIQRRIATNLHRKFQRDLERQLMSLSVDTCKTLYLQDVEAEEIAKAFAVVAATPEGVPRVSPGGGVLSVEQSPQPTAEEGLPLNYLGMTAAEDWRRVKAAKTVHIISTPWDKTNPIAGRKAAATKDHFDNSVQGVYVFNPNTGLRAAADMTEEQQGAEWLRLWAEVLERVRDTGGNCYVMAKSTGPDQYKLEGGGQKGEMQVAKLSLDPGNTGRVGPSGHWESERIIYVTY